MGNMLVFPVGSTKACHYAVEFLKYSGVAILDHPAPEVTHLLLDVPSFGADGTLRGGGDLEALLEMLPATVIVVGGNLAHPMLEGYQTIDLLQDVPYLAENAAITADCALQVAAQRLTTTFSDTPTLIIGWGRIGKCLGQLLKGIGTDVTVAARKESDRAILRALQFPSVDICELPKLLPRFRLIFNTAPEMVLNKEMLSPHKNCVKIDLASRPGLKSSDVIWARGLPGMYAPESSGRLIAKTFLRRNQEVRK